MQEEKEPKPSLYQRRVPEFVRSGVGNAVVRATAGSGKTTTLVQVANRLPEDLKVCFLAFARNAADELKQRLPADVDARTVHSLGNKTLFRHLQSQGISTDVKRDKYRSLIKEALKEINYGHVLSPDEQFECFSYLKDLVEFSRLNLIDTKNENNVRDLAIRYNLTPPESPELEIDLHHHLRRILRRGLEQTEEEGIVDFIDMMYIPFIRNIQPEQYDFVCIDEAQDYSPLALEFTMRSVGENGRLLFVGDPRQSIFGFAGADSDALDRIIKKTNATVLPLSISYRCPKRHIKLASIIAPEIEASPNAIEGRVFWIKDQSLEKWAHEKSMILCRANAPLMRTCLRLVRSGRSANIQGRDLASQIKHLSEKIFRKNFDNYILKLEGYEQKEEARLRKVLAGQANLDSIIAQGFDITACLRYLLDELAQHHPPSQQSLNQLIQKTFAEDENAVLLSSIHRAKGKEANRVIILYPDLMPSSYAKTAEAIKGEACVQFVALTRAKRDLIFVESPPKENPFHYDEKLDS